MIVHALCDALLLFSARHPWKILPPVLKNIYGQNINIQNILSIIVIVFLITIINTTFEMEIQILVFQYGCLTCVRNNICIQIISLLNFVVSN